MDNLEALRATHEALNDVLALVWRDAADLHAVRRAADVLRRNHAAHGLALTASLVDGGPEPLPPAQ
ncbi:MAG: hypothetical protein KF878_09890 [Planctomycetes bacterium]|nr:hypothetical protein [Planctomycetota bacterium]